MRTGLTNNRNVLTATTHRSTATPVYLQYPKYVAGVEHALHMAYKHLICKCKNSFAFTDFQFANCRFVKHIGQRTLPEKASGGAS